jgi:phosphoribosyl 1,2-cyclic phosphodiesterase
VKLQVLSSGSEGNCALVRAGGIVALCDAGLPRTALDERLASARLASGAIEHVLVTHGHLDHARSAGLVARRERATLHCALNLMSHASVRRAKRFSTISPGAPFALASERGGIDELAVAPVPLPHDCDPTVAFRFEHQGRVAVVLTDMGRPDDAVARALRGAHVLVLEFNWDPELMERSPYPAALRRRIAGDRGHLSNAQGAAMLERLAGAELHTLVLAHLSKKTNHPDRALEAARGVLCRLGLEERVRVLVASQDEAGPELEV